MIALRQGFVPISHFQSDDGSKEAIIYFGEKLHKEQYLYGDFIDHLNNSKSRFIIFPRDKYTILRCEDEAENFVQQERTEEDASLLLPWLQKKDKAA